MSTIAILFSLYHSKNQSQTIFQLSPGFEEYPLYVAGLIIEYKME